MTEKSYRRYCYATPFRFAWLSTSDCLARPGKPNFRSIPQRFANCNLFIFAYPAKLRHTLSYTLLRSYAINLIVSRETRNSSVNEIIGISLSLESHKTSNFPQKNFEWLNVARNEIPQTFFAKRRHCRQPQLSASFLPDRVPVLARFQFEVSTFEELLTTLLTTGPPIGQTPSASLSCSFSRSFSRFSLSLAELQSSLQIPLNFQLTSLVPNFRTFNFKSRFKINLLAFDSFQSFLSLILLS